MNFKFKSPKKFLTFFGEIELNRSLYQHDRGGKCFIPLDQKWGVVNEYAAPDVQEIVLYATAHLIPKETQDLLKKSSFFNPSTTAIKNLIDESGEVIDQHNDQIFDQIIQNEKIPEQTKILACSLDGVNVLLREKGVKKGRKPQRPQISGDQGDESKTCYKNAMVGTISFYDSRKLDEKHPKRLGTKYLARMPEERAVSFKAQYEKNLENIMTNVSNNVDKLLILDGARGLWNYVQNKSLYNDFKKLIDFYHTAEHLSKAAEAIFGKKNKKARDWFKKYKNILLTNENGGKKAIRSIEYYLQEGELSKLRKQDLKTELTFFRRNYKKMKYHHFLEKGWPIGSGPVEAACKSIVKTRLCRSGMRWMISGGQAVLNLRSIVKSERWETFWPVYRELKKSA